MHEEPSLSDRLLDQSFKIITLCFLVNVIVLLQYKYL